MPEALWAGMLAGYGIAVPVGPIAVLIFDTGLRRGLRVAAPAGAGAASADGFYATLAGLVGAAVAGPLAPVLVPARLAGAALLGIVAVRGLVAAARFAGQGTGTTPVPGGFPGGSARAQEGPARTYLFFLALTIVNPLTFVYFGALMVGLPATAAEAEKLVFAAGAFAASLSWQLLLAGAGSVLHGRLPPRAQAFTRTAGAIIVLALALRLALAAG